MLSYTFDSKGLKFINSIPGSRRLIKPIFIFFANFDDLWLYNYLNIDFNYVMQNTFDSVQKL